MPSYPHLIKLENGTHIYLKGDENCKWGISESGYTVLPSEDGWVYAKRSSKGFAEPSAYKFEKQLNSEIKSFLQSQPKRIPIEPNKNQCNDKNLLFEIEQKGIIGERKALIILMSFSDLEFNKSKDDFNRLFNEKGYSEDGAVGSVSDYFAWSSSNQLDFSCDIIGPFRSSHDMKYYGKNIGSEGRDQNTFKLFEEALTYAKETINLSDYDSNGDGYIDNFHIIFAGYGEEAGARSDAIWSHEMTFPAVEVGELKIDRYSCAPELRGNSGNGISRIGPHCHEMGHALGAMDYYDVDYSNNGQFPGTGQWDIMATGSWNEDGKCPPDFNPYVKIYNFGWCQPQPLKPGYNEIVPLTYKQDQIFILRTPEESDFYLIENRIKDSFDSGIPGEGLLIFHIGPEIESLSKTNAINSSYPQQCYVVCASSDFKCPTKSAASYGNIDSSGCPFPGTSNNNEFNALSVPAALCFNGSESGIELSEISYIERSSNISLYNGTPATPIYAWVENFESSQWNDEWSQNDGEWKLANKIQDNDNIGDSFPIKHDSNYLYSKLPTSLNNKVNIRTIQSSPIKIENDYNYSLHLQYYNSPQVNSNRKYDNVLNIYIKFPNQDLYLLDSLEKTDYSWTDINIPLPELGYFESLNFVFQHQGTSAGYSCLDNIKLQKQEKNYIEAINDSDIPQFDISLQNHKLIIYSYVDTHIYILDTAGRVIVNREITNGETSFEIANGIYILQSSCKGSFPLKLLVR